MTAIPVLAIQANHAVQLVETLRADLQARQLDTSTAIRQFRRDNAVGLLLAAEQLLQSVTTTLRAIADDLPAADCLRPFLTRQDRMVAQEASNRG